MGDIVQFVLNALPGPLADLLDALFHVEFWKLLTGAVVLALSVVVLSSLPDHFRDRVKLFFLVALALFATIAVLRPFGWSAILG